MAYTLPTLAIGHVFFFCCLASLIYVLLQRREGQARCIWWELGRGPWSLDPAQCAESCRRPRWSCVIGPPLPPPPLPSPLLVCSNLILSYPAAPLITMRTCKADLKARHISVDSQPVIRSQRWVSVFVHVRIAKCRTVGVGTTIREREVLPE